MKPRRCVHGRRSPGWSSYPDHLRLPEVVTISGMHRGNLTEPSCFAPFRTSGEAFGAALIRFTVVVVVTAAAGAIDDPAVVGRTTFVLDGNRIYAQVGFLRPDMSVHPALAYIDMGSETMTIRAALLNELQLNRADTVRF